MEKVKNMKRQKPTTDTSNIRRVFSDDIFLDPSMRKNMFANDHLLRKETKSFEEVDAFCFSDSYMPINSHDGFLVHNPEDKKLDIDRTFYKIDYEQQSRPDNSTCITELFNKRKNETVKINTEKSFKEFEQDLLKKKMEQLDLEREKNKSIIDNNRHLFD